MALKVEGILTHSELDAMGWEDLLREYEDFVAYRKRENEAIEARIKEGRR